MTFDPMTKMNISILAMFLMFVTNLLVILSRKAANRVIAWLLKAVAFLMLIAILVMIVIVVFL